MNRNGIIDPPGIVRTVDALAELAGRINAEHNEALSAARASLVHARNAGLLLLDARKQCDHGQWLPWLKDNVRFSERTAQTYMRVAKRWPELEAKAQLPAHLTIEDALKLLVAPTTDEESNPQFPALLDGESNPTRVSDLDNEANPQATADLDDDTALGPPVLACYRDAELLNDDCSVREELESVAQSAHVEEAIGADGKSYPARREREPGEDDDVFDRRDEEHAEPQVLFDEADKPVPPQAYGAFNQKSDLRVFLKMLDQAAKKCEAIGKSPVGIHMHWIAAQASIKSARKTLYAGRPAHVCPYCEGEKKDCRACRGHGFVTATSYEQRPEAQEAKGRK
jgi:hypothetical protein